MKILVSYQMATAKTLGRLGVQMNRIEFDARLGPDTQADPKELEESDCTN